MKLSDMEVYHFLTRLHCFIALSITVGHFHLQILDSVGQTHPHSTNSKSNIFGGQGSYVSADIYHIVRPIMTVSVLNMYRLIFFLLLFFNQLFA